MSHRQSIFKSCLLLKSFNKRNELDKSIKYVNNLPKDMLSQVVIWNKLLYQFSSRGKVKESFKIFNSIRKQSEPNGETYTLMLQSCANGIKNNKHKIMDPLFNQYYLKGTNLFLNLSKSNLFNILHVNSFITLATKARDWNSIFKIYQKLDSNQNPVQIENFNKKSWFVNQLKHGQNNRQNNHTVLSSRKRNMISLDENDDDIHSDSLMSENKDNIGKLRPNLVTFSVIMTACGVRGGDSALDDALFVWNDLIKLDRADNNTDNNHESESVVERFERYSKRVGQRHGREQMDDLFENNAILSSPIKVDTDLANSLLICCRQSDSVENLEKGLVFAGLLFGDAFDWKIVQKFLDADHLIKKEPVSSNTPHDANTAQDVDASVHLDRKLHATFSRMESIHSKSDRDQQSIIHLDMSTTSETVSSDSIVKGRDMNHKKIPTHGEKELPDSKVNDFNISKFAVESAEIQLPSSKLKPNTKTFHIIMSILNKLSVSHNHQTKIYSFFTKPNPPYRIYPTIISDMTMDSHHLNQLILCDIQTQNELKLKGKKVSSSLAVDFFLNVYVKKYLKCNDKNRLNKKLDLVSISTFTSFLFSLSNLEPFKLKTYLNENGIQTKSSIKSTPQLIFANVLYNHVRNLYNTRPLEFDQLTEFRVSRKTGAYKSQSPIGSFIGSYLNALVVSKNHFGVLKLLESLSIVEEEMNMKTRNKSDKPRENQKEHQSFSIDEKDSNFANNLTDESEDKQSKSYNRETWLQVVARESQKTRMCWYAGVRSCDFLLSRGDLSNTWSTEYPKLHLKRLRSTFVKILDKIVETNGHNQVHQKPKDKKLRLPEVTSNMNYVPKWLNAHIDNK